MKPWQIVCVMCTAHVFSMAGFATFPALLPTLLPLWELSNTQAGWISGIFFAGYVAAVPILVTLTDRVDSRRIYLVGVAISAIGRVLVGDDLAGRAGRRHRRYLHDRAQGDDRPGARHGAVARHRLLYRRLLGRYGAVVRAVR
jgi:hypothetical protein